VIEKDRRQALSRSRSHFIFSTAENRPSWQTAQEMDAGHAGRDCDCGHRCLFPVNRASLFGNKTPTASPSLEPTVSLVSSPLGPTGVLRFQDGTAIVDQATLTALAMPAPPAGNQYEVWLVDSRSGARRSLGILGLDENGRGTLTFHDSRAQNLLGLYDKVEITIKPRADSNADGFEQIAYSYTLPEAGLEFVRRLLVSSSLAPGQIALIQGLATNARLIDQTARGMLTAYESEDQSATRQGAEAILNLLTGSQSQEYKDWDGDGQTADPGDGYGLFNENNLGYIQAVYSHADYAANSPGASPNMIVNGERVKTCAQNLAQEVPQLRERVLTILNSASFSDMDKPVHDAVALADQMLNGIDQDEDGEIEPLSGECGVLTAYQYAYYMADMPLLPVNPLDTPTATAHHPPLRHRLYFYQPAYEHSNTVAQYIIQYTDTDSAHEQSPNQSSE
jgi:hypothetical protein